MKVFLFILFFISFSSLSFSQNDSIVSVKDTNTYMITLNDGGEIIGKILSKDKREILVLTNEGQEIYIPLYSIKSKVIVNNSDFGNDGVFIGEDRFATRYFISTNGLPIKKGEHYVQWNLFGPDFQFGVADNFSIGIMTTWIAAPVVVSFKRSFQLGENAQFAVGAMAGTMAWFGLENGGALPFASLSFGNRRSNISFSGGAVFTTETDGAQPLASVAGMTKIGRKISLVFESFMVLPNGNNTGGALIVPGLRFHQAEGKAIQFGFAGIVSDGEAVPFPIPMVQWYRSL